MKVRNFETNERYRLCNRNKHLPVHFYLATPSSEKLVFVPLRAKTNFSDEGVER